MQKKSNKKSGVSISELSKRLAKKTPVNTPKIDVDKMHIKNALSQVKIPKQKVEKKTPAKKKGGLKVSDKTMENPDLKNLQLPDIYIAFTQWFAIPKDLRNLKTQKEFAKAYGVSEDTLSKWRQRPNFWKTTETSVKSHFQELISDGLQAMYNKSIIRKGDPRAMTVFLQYVANFNPKTIVELPPAPENQIPTGDVNELTSELKKSGLAILKEANKKLLDKFVEQADEVDELGDL